MRPQEYLNYPVLDIIFENRNKTYGAYALRNGYEQSVRKALIISILLILSTFLAPYIYAKIAGSVPKEAALTTVHVELMNEPIDLHEQKAKVVVQKKQAEAPKASKPTIAYNVPLVVIDTKTIETPSPSPTDTKIEIGNKNTNGSDGSIGLDDAKNNNKGDDTSTKDEHNESKEPLVVIEQQAEFPDGLQSLYKWLSANVKYPSICRENGISGKTIVRFIVEKDGSVTNPQVLRGSTHEALDNEALRVVKIMPHWKPGKQQGHAVRSYFTLPIKFSWE